MTDKIDVEARFTATDEASPIIRSLLRDVQRLRRAFGKPTAAYDFFPRDLQAKAKAASVSVEGIADSYQAAGKAAQKSVGMQNQALKKRMGFEAKMMRQKAREEADRYREEARRYQESMRALRSKLAFEGRMGRQRAAEERRAAADHRQRLRHIEAERRADRRTYRDRLRMARDRGGSLYDRITPSYGAVAATVAGSYATRRVLMAEADVESAELNAVAYGGLSKEAARKLRIEWAGPAGIDLGSTQAEMLTGYTEALKLGVPEDAAKQFASLAVQVSEAWQIPIEAVQDALGQTTSILKSDGSPFKFGQLRSAANALQYLAAKQSTTPAKLLEFQMQGAGGAALLGMSQEAGLAFGSASTSLGNRAGESGRLLDYLASRIIEMPRLVRGRGDEGKQARKLLSVLGYGSADRLNQDRRADPDKFLFDFIGRFAKIKNPKERDEAIRFLTGREWLGEFGRLVTGQDLMREAQALAIESRQIDAIGKVWSVHTQKLLFAGRQMYAGLMNVVGEIGMVLSPLGKDIRTAWLRISHEIIDSGKLRQSLQAFIDGIVEGFMGPGRSFADMMDSLVASLSIGIDPETFNRFGKGFAKGLKAVAGIFGATVSAFATMSGIDASSAEGLGEVIASLIGLSAALFVLKPALGVLEGLKDFALATAGVLGSIAALKTLGAGSILAGILGPLAGGTAGLMGGAAIPIALTAITAGLVLGVTVMNWNEITGAVRDLISPAADPAKALADRAKSINESFGWGSVGDYLGIGLSTLRGLLHGFEPAKPAAGQDHPPSKMSSTAIYGYARPVDPVIDRAGLYAHLDSPSYAIDRLTGEMAALRGDLAAGMGDREDLTDRIMTGGSSGGGAQYDVSALSGSAAASSSSIARPMIDSDEAMAALSGRSATTGSAKTLLDSIARAEGTAGKGDYETVLGYGRYGKPDKPLTDMTLSEAYKFGRRVRSRHGSSSAIGRYQIVGSTMKEMAKRLGLDWQTTKFDTATQDAMALEIARRQGLGAWEGFKRHRGEKGIARDAIDAGALRSSPSPAVLSGQAAAVSYANSGIRNRQVTDNLMGSLQEAIAAVYGPGYRGEIYSGGQPRKGSSGRRTGSTRHDDHGHGGRAADTYVYGPDGKRLRGDALAPLAQWWLAQNKGSVGLEMRGGGIHLDEITRDKLAPGQSLAWDYGGLTKAQSAAIRDGLAGINPTLAARLAPQNVPLPTARPATASAITSKVQSPLDPASITSKVPSPEHRMGGAAGSSIKNKTTNHITVNGAGQNPEQTAAAVERRLSERRKWQSNDVEFA